MSEEKSPAGQPSADPPKENGELPRPKSLPADQEWDHVEFTKEQQGRFNRIYAEMKSTQDDATATRRLMKKMGEDNRKLIEKMEEMEAGRVKAATESRVSDLAKQEKAALEDQDFERAGRVRDQITDLKVEAKIPKEKPKEDPPEEVYESWLTPPRAKALNDFANAKDDKGDLLHPWADADHPEYETAINAAQVVIQRNPELPIEEILEKIAKVNDRVITKRSTATVLGSGGDAPKPKKKTAITEDEKNIAAAMGMTPERYMAAKEKYS